MVPRRQLFTEFGLVSIVVALWAIVLSGHCAACGPAIQPAVDITALELACVSEASTSAASKDCRNAVRAAWAKANNMDAGPLEGGSGAVVFVSEGGGQ